MPGAHEVCSFLAPMTVQPVGKDDELAPGRVAKLRVSDVHGHCGTGLFANAGCSTLEGPAPGTEDA